MSPSCLFCFLCRGLYIGYLKLRTFVDAIHVVVQENCPNVLPHVKIRDNPNVSRWGEVFLKSRSFDKYFCWVIVLSPEIVFLLSVILLFYGLSMRSLVFEQALITSAAERAFLHPREDLIRVGERFAKGLTRIITTVRRLVSFSPACVG